MRKTFAQGKSAASVKQWLSSITGNVVVYDLKHGEIQHEVIFFLASLHTLQREFYCLNLKSEPKLLCYFSRLSSNI